ncbi:ubiquitin-like small modifier protein 1 [Haloarculaceae archaeon H-GB2-1]|nr:MoaD/ThiS family protein [Haloarculaceae archaeon H-GB1-1]MEA5385977.1 ubiquitin-like small modifier protein 1 [Haloarculaceae archaeon H-GB11]MEA5407480.1 ubiquitin-like small modifier protein 1 [Haloarculaceae archaeon H-GB2-1]
MQWKLFANLAETVGDRNVTVDVEDGATVGDALDALLAAHPTLEDDVLDEDGDLYDHIQLLHNGTNPFAEGDGLETPVAADDELALFPPVSGG